MGDTSPTTTELIRRALAGDPAAVRALRRLGILRDEPGDGLYPASPAQQSLWLWQQQQPGSTLYSLPTVLAVPAGVSPALVERAVNVLFERHESLRTVFVARDGVPLQRVLPVAAAPVPDRELGQAEALALIRDDLARPFDLEQGPLARCFLLRTAHGLGLYLNAHHLVLDGLSQLILQRELAALLEAFRAGDPSPLAPPQWQYRDFAAWHDRLLQGRRGQQLQARWRARLAGLLPLDLPTDFPRPAARTYHGDTLTASLGPEADAAVSRLTRLAGCTPLCALAWGVAVVLARYAGQEDITLGLPCSGRTRPETEGLVGLFVNLAPLRLRLESKASVSASLARAKESLAETLELQDYPYGRLVEEVPTLRMPDRNPLFDVVVVMQQAPPGGALGRAAAPAGRGSKFDLSVHFEDGSEGLRVSLEYSTALFLPGRMERLADHLRRALTEAARDPDVSLGDLDILPPAERRCVVDRFNATARPYPRGADIAQVFAEVAARVPDSPALLWGDAAVQSRWTYAELDRRAEDVADALAGPADVRPGQAVGLALPRGAGQIAALLGILKAGAAYMPLDASLPPARLRRMVELSGCPLALAQGGSAQALGDAIPGMALLDPDDLPAAPPRGPAAVGGAGPAYVLFTSGSTGEPKAVVIPHRAVLRLVLSAAPHRVRPTDAVLQAAPLAFDASTLEIWGPLLVGARLCLAETEALLAPGGLARLIGTFGITYLWLTASLCHRVAEDAPESFRPLRILLTGGEVLSPRHMRRILTACPDLALLNGYGPTENTTFTTTHAISLADTAGPIPLGRPIANTRVYILDRWDHPAPVGVWGELVTAGDGLALGYRGRPDLTAAAFVILPWLPDERLYRTGDIARWRADGRLEFQGRRDGQVKIRGYRVELEEVEVALRAVPGVREAVVLALESDGEGADGRELVAVVRAERGEPDAWRRDVAALLPPYMVPARFLSVPAIPLNASGKADRQALIPLAAASRPAPLAAPPMDAQEAAVAAVFEEILGRAGVGREEDFFQLGGHSVKAMRLLAKLEQRLGRTLALRDFWAGPTVAAVAARLREAGAGRPAERGT